VKGFDHFSEDPLVNAVYQGIKPGIQVTYDQGCYGSCLILIYCGIDAMTYLSLPPERDEVCGADFVKWAGKYLSPHLSSKNTVITGEELYSARCAVVHTYTVESKTTKLAKVRKIGYGVERNVSPIVSSGTVPDLVMLRLDVLRDAFFKAIDRFLVEAYADNTNQATLEKRMNKLLMATPRKK